MASKEQVRNWARQKQMGMQIDDDQQAAIDRTITQAGLEGRRVERILRGEREE